MEVQIWCWTYTHFYNNSNVYTGLNQGVAQQPYLTPKSTLLRVQIWLQINRKNNNNKKIVYAGLNTAVAQQPYCSPKSPVMQVQIWLQINKNNNNNKKIVYAGLNKAIAQHIPSLNLQ